MTEDFQSKPPSLNPENIHKSFDLTCRIDERIKLVENNQENLNKKFENYTEKHIELIKQIAIVESHYTDLLRSHQEINNLEKRLSKIEIDHGNHSERWKIVASFIVQLIWVILAAYLLTKLNLQSPAIT
jgi:predicted RNase H-like nuclease (RuvC/YqgF family)